MQQDNEDIQILFLAEFSPNLNFQTFPTMDGEHQLMEHVED